MRQNIPELTSLRFIAALAVVISHMHGLGFIDVPALHHFLDGGRPAVAFFFTLSGFVLTLRYKPNDIDMRYHQARFARIYPVHLLGLALSAPTVLYIAFSDPILADSMFALKGNVTLLLIASMLCQLFLLTAWTPVAGLNQPWNGPAWSLSCEAFFYALFPTLRGIFIHRSTKWLLGLIAVAWVMQGLWGAIVPLILPPTRSGFMISQFPLPHLFEFLTGMICGTLFDRGDLKGLQNYWAPAAIGAVICLGILSAVQPVHPAYFAQGPFFALLISAVAVSPGIPILRHKFGVLLGAASYSLYIIHVPILMAMSLLKVSLPPAVTLVALIAGSVIIFTCVEEPMRHLIMSMGRRRAAAASSA